MADEPNEGEEPEIVMTDEPEGEQVETEEQHEEDDGETVIEIEGDEEAEEAESAPIRQMRAQLAEERRLRAAAEARANPKPAELGPKPTLESCEWDEEKFAEELEAWHGRKSEADRAETERNRAQAEAAEKGKRVEAAYAAKAASFQQRAKITPEEYRQNEQIVVDDLMTGSSEALKPLVLGYIDNPEVLIRTLATRPTLREKMKAIDDPVARFLAMRDLSKGIKVVTKRKSPPPPEERLSGTGRISQPNTAKELEALEKEAAKTGDRTKIIAFKRKQKENAK